MTMLTLAFDYVNVGNPRAKSDFIMREMWLYPNSRPTTSAVIITKPTDFPRGGMQGTKVTFEGLPYDA